MPDRFAGARLSSGNTEPARGRVCGKDRFARAVNCGMLLSMIVLVANLRAYAVLWAVVIGGVQGVGPLARCHV